MKTHPTVSRFVELSDIVVQPDTQAKAAGEGDSYKFMRISSDHYACITDTPIKGGTDSNSYIIIEKDGKIGCSCPGMTYRGACKHIAKFIALPEPPQIPASEEIVRKLILMGWVGGRDDLHPAEQSPSIPATADGHEDVSNCKPEMEHYECPKCGTAVDIVADELTNWKLNHIDICSGRKKAEPLPKEDVPKSPEVPENVGVVAPLGSGIIESDTAPAHTPDTIMPPIHSESRVSPNLATALCNMQKVDLLAVTDSNNPFHNAKYADLASVWAAIRKPLTDNGLAVIQTTEPYPQGVTVVTTFVHISGETYSSRLSCEVPISKPDKNGQIKPNIQGLGSTITYLRRYSLAAMTGVAQIDDDGEAAMSR